MCRFHQECLVLRWATPQRYPVPIHIVSRGNTLPSVPLNEYGLSSVRTERIRGVCVIAERNEEGLIHRPSEDSVSGSTTLPFSLSHPSNPEFFHRSFINLLGPPENHKPPPFLIESPLLVLRIS